MIRDPKHVGAIEPYLSYYGPDYVRIMAEAWKRRNEPVSDHMCTDPDDCPTSV